uniref:Elongation of very long chain fatty acids protein n=1 Tax=Timema poppense TaxID=170557 RepID=A0A7R9D851_TIMPO|nr:unnamed protein product [Timema poppensis]
MIVPSYSEVFTRGSVNAAHDKVTGLLEPSANLREKHGVMAAHVLASIQNKELPIILINLCPSPVTLRADPRVKDWPLIGSPVYLLVIIALYLFFVLVAGPKFMENRRPYNLKKIIAAYNILQVLANAYLFYGTLTSGWTDKISLGCYPIKYEDDPDLKLAGMVWKTFILKIVDFLDTMFFVLRKKNNQVTFLHVYHHVSTAGITFIAAKYFPGGGATFPILPNTLVHVLMYTYYLLALQGPEMQKKLAKFKKYLTTIQLVQFVMLVAHAFQGFLPGCDFPMTPILIYIPNIVVFFYLFNNFYINTYNNREKKD